MQKHEEQEAPYSFIDKLLLAFLFLGFPSNDTRLNFFLLLSDCILKYFQPLYLSFIFWETLNRTLNETAIV